MSLRDFKNRGALDKILKPIIADDRYIYPITTRHKQQLVQFADKLLTIFWIVRVFRSTHPALKADDRLTNGIVDEEVAPYARHARIHPKDKTGRLSCFQEAADPLLELVTSAPTSLTFPWP